MSLPQVWNERNEEMVTRLVRWNLTDQAAPFEDADAIIVSVPKSGRTWVRVLLSAYRSHVQGSDFSIDPGSADDTQHPRIVFAHDLFEHLNKTRFKDRITGRRLIPQGVRRSRRIAMLVRDPRDVAVSLYFDLKKRQRGYRYDPSSIAELIRHRRFGLEAIIGIMNAWMREWAGRPNFSFFRYEDMRLDTEKVFGDLLTFLGFGPVDPSALRFSIEFSRFENMKKMEASGEFSTEFLQARNPDDPDSYKVRRGKVGGFRDYFSPADLAFAEANMKKLDRRLGYS